jgi:hypothetical protein
MTTTAELIGPALDWAVAQCEGRDVTAWRCPEHDAYYVVSTDCFRSTNYCYGQDEVYYPSVDWSEGGPIIEREEISLTTCGNGQRGWAAKGAHNYSYGPTPLIAAMRCYVASKLGPEVEIPDGL